MNTSISPKLKMILSIVAFLFALLLSWAAFNFAMPTQMLAIRKAEAQHCLPPGTWELCRPSLDYKARNVGGYYFSRRGDEFYIVQPYQNSGPFWNDTLGPYRMAPLSPHAIGFELITDVKNGSVHVTTIENLILVTTPDPHVARVELLLNDQTAECTESAPGSGFWTGTVYTTHEHNLDAIRARAYDAAGNLIGPTPP